MSCAARWLAGALSAVAALMVTLVGSTVAQAASPTQHPVWCGHWNANPVASGTKQVGASQVTNPSDGSIAELIWGTYGGETYVWADLRGPMVGTGDHIALDWNDNQNHATYQCGDSHDYSTATVWPGTNATWTAGVPVEPNTGANAGDAYATCAGYTVWNSAGSVIGGTNGSCTAPWNITASPPSYPPPVPAPPPASAPPASPAPSACGEPSAGPQGLRLQAWVRPAKAARRRTIITIGYRQRSIVSGRVLTADGSPAAGARVCITARNDVLGARTLSIGTVTTDPHGRFSYTWRAGCSRRFWLTSNAGGGQASATVRVRVRASVSVHASPTSLFNGQAMTLSGRLHGGPLPRGAIVELQVFRGTYWETFGTANVSRGRTFSFSYRFTNTLTSWTYVFRARVPTQPGDAFAAGWSRQIPVLVRG